MPNRFQIAIIIAFFLPVNIVSQEIILLFAGDAMQHQTQIDNAQREGKYDYSSYFKNLKDEISAADISVVNLEVTLGGKPYKGYPAFSAPDEFAAELQSAGFDIFLTANNHCLDRRERGLLRTINVLDSFGIIHTGTFRDSADRAANYPLTVEKNGFKIAMLNYTYGTNGIQLPTASQCIVNYIDSAKIREDIAAARNKNPDLIIANMHWGDEYKLQPNATQRNLAKFLIDEGVSFIVGSHPHVVQPIEEIADSAGNRHITVFSLGNFVSAMKTADTSGGMIVKIKLKKENNVVEMLSCENQLFFVNQENNGGKTDFSLVPVAFGEEAITPRLRNRMKLFLKNLEKSVKQL